MGVVEAHAFDAVLVGVTEVGVALDGLGVPLVDQYPAETGLGVGGMALRARGLGHPFEGGEAPHRVVR